MSELGFQTKLYLNYDQAIEKVTGALKDEGFGVLTSIDVKDTMKKKIDADFRKYVILGVCNPQLAFKALNARIDVGLLLPCSVIVYEDEAGSVVNILDPMSMTQLIQDPALTPVAEEARARLQRVHAALVNN